MMTVNEVSKLTGVSIRALQYYDRIGLLHPAEYTRSGYRLYDDAALERLQQILLFRELEFPLKEIKRILNAPDFDRNCALEQQITMLEMKKEHLENLILFARGILLLGVKNMDFSVFDTKKLDDYAKEAKESWGKTPAFQEYEEKCRNWTKKDEKAAAEEVMELFAQFGEMLSLPPADSAVQGQVKKLQDYITEHFYTCDLNILRSLGSMYVGDGRFTENIDEAGGKGTASFVRTAIEIYCDNQEKDGAL